MNAVIARKSGFKNTMRAYPLGRIARRAVRWFGCRASAAGLVALLYGVLVSCAGQPQRAGSAPVSGARYPSAVEREEAIAVEQPGPHEGGGTTTAYPFFAKAPGLGFVFRKRVLHPGSSIGSHPHDKDEIYYVLRGQGELTLDGERSVIGAGTAVLTRPGSTHALKQVGAEDLVIFIVYQEAPRSGQ